MTSFPAEAPRPLTLPGVGVPVCGDRSLFPDLEPHSFLAHAAISPASRATSEAVKAFLDHVARVGVGAFPIWAAQRERLRRSLGELLDADAQDVALTAGCTKGISDLALALPLGKDDIILTYRGEFPANVIPWKLAAEAKGARVEFLDLPEPTDEDCQRQIVSTLLARLARADRPKWLALSGVQFQTGLRMPLPAMMEVCRRYKTHVFVDGIQGAGVVPWSLRELGVDALFAGAHKWLLGLEGVGLGYFSSALMEEIRPVTAGWLSYPDAESFLFKGPGHLSYERELKTTPQVFEGSTASAMGFAALEGGVDILLHLGTRAVYEHIQAFHDEIEPRLVALGFSSLRSTDQELRSGLLAFRPPSGVRVPELAAGLRARGVTISIPDGFVRLAPHFSNSLTEVPLVERAFREVLKSL